MAGFQDIFYNPYYNGEYLGDLDMKDLETPAALHDRYKSFSIAEQRHMQEPLLRNTSLLQDLNER